jgi:hypothetical protein
MLLQAAPISHGRATKKDSKAQGSNIRGQQKQDHGTRLVTQEYGDKSLLWLVMLLQLSVMMQGTQSRAAYHTPGSPTNATIPFSPPLDTL